MRFKREVPRVVSQCKRPGEALAGRTQNHCSRLRNRTRRTARHNAHLA
jgi:hypothetical protein